MSKFLKEIMRTTNYFNTFIELSEDCPAGKGEMPPLKGIKKTIANLQFEMLYENPYKYTSDELFFAVLSIRNGFTKKEFEEQWAIFFSKGQPCFRASPLTKKYGWGIHSNENGRIAMYGAETEEYKRFVKDNSIKKVEAMRNKRK